MTTVERVAPVSTQPAGGLVSRAGRDGGSPGHGTLHRSAGADTQGDMNLGRVGSAAATTITSDPSTTADGR